MREEHGRQQRDVSKRDGRHSDPGAARQAMVWVRLEAVWNGLRSVHISVDGQQRTRRRRDASPAASRDWTSSSENQQGDTEGRHESNQQFHLGLLEEKEGCWLASRLAC
ncbi:hypothetical protein [Paraburkholderia phosphatilytica]|uniref:hypothetical protein n=1 Tax=Paraburkholderia phosphatilytica TaxID=2282883 RepID=UPI000E557EE1|nr:hypothetical protein [Paraburkholderia phosphatilytica]